MPTIEIIFEMNFDFWTNDRTGNRDLPELISQSINSIEIGYLGIGAAVDYANGIPNLTYNNINDAHTRCKWCGGDTE